MLQPGHDEITHKRRKETNRSYRIL
uniref:Uncharacterized protein n=1 Tax=Arundo donax TaxID=35708 RepID=A0A0A8YSM9_ARUDO